MARKSPPPPLDLSFDTRPKRLPQIARDEPVDIESKPLIISPCSQPEQTGPVGKTLRISCSFIHMLLSTALLLVLIFFLGFRPEAAQTHQGPVAIALAVILGLDISLSLLSIGFAEQLMRSCLLSMRLLLTGAYFGLLVPILARGMFPAGYGFWGLAPRLSNVLTAVCLGCIIILNLAHGIIDRRSLKSFARMQMEKLGVGVSKGELVATSSGSRSSGTGSSGMTGMSQDQASVLYRL